MGAYNLFQRKGCEALYCAVPADFAVPGFLGGISWNFIGRIEAGTSPAPSGFDETAAELVIPLNGFYLFQDVVEQNS